MKRSILLSLVLFAGFWDPTLLSAEVGYDEPMKMKDEPTVQVPLHKDWFTLEYNEVSNETILRTKEEFGPGNPPANDAGDAMKMDISGVVEGKTLESATGITALLYFHRMAGVANDSDGLLFKGHDKEFKPVDQDSKRVLVFEGVDQVYFLTPSGKRFVVEGEDNVLHRTKRSEGFLREHYLWETVVVGLSWSELNRLKNGGKVSIGNRIIRLGPDQVSLIQTFIAIVEGLKP